MLVAPCAGLPDAKSTWSSSAPRATRSSPRSWSARPPAPATTRCRPISPSCCWCGSTSSTSRAARSCARPRRRAPGHPRAAGGRRRRRRRGARRAPAHGRRAQHAGRRGPGYAFRHALLGEAVYDDLLPGERVRLHRPRTPPRSARRAREHGCRAGPARPRPTTTRPRSGPASRPATRRAVGGPDEAAQHFERALRLLAGLGDAATAWSTAPGWPSARPRRSRQRAPRAGSRAARRAARRPARRRPPTTRGSLLAARAVALTADRDRRGPARDLRGGRSADADDDTGSAPGCSPRTPTCSPCSGGTRRPSRSASTPSRSPSKLDRTDLAAEVIAGSVRAAPGPSKERLREALREAMDRAVETGARARRAARPLPARPLLPGLGRARRGRALVLELRSSARRRAGIEWAPYGSGARWHLTWVLSTRGDWDDVHELDRPLGQPPPADGAGDVREPAGRGPGRLAARTSPTAARPAADVAARRRPRGPRRRPGDPARHPARRRRGAPGRPTTT